MEQNKYDALTNALKKAIIAADAYINSEDGGTCNFDSPVVDYLSMHMVKHKAKEAIKAAGLSCFEWSGYGSNRLVVCGIGCGHGNRRSRMAEEAQRSLKAYGIASSMYYQMD